VVILKENRLLEELEPIFRHYPVIRFDPFSATAPESPFDTIYCYLLDPLRLSEGRRRSLPAAGHAIGKFARCAFRVRLKNM